MPYQKCKIYNDGSHFIAIPHTTRPAAPKRYRPEEVIEVIDDTSQQPQLNTDTPFDKVCGAGSDKFFALKNVNAYFLKNFCGIVIVVGKRHAA